MEHQFHAQTQLPAIEYLMQILQAFVGVTFLMGTSASLVLALPVDCRRLDLSKGGAIEDIAAGVDRSRLAFPPTFTIQRDLLPAPVLETSPLLKRSRVTHGPGSELNCWSQSFRMMPLSNHTTTARAVGKDPVKFILPVMKFSASPYIGKRQAFQTRMILPEMTITSRERTASIIGPIDEHSPVDPSNGTSLPQALGIRRTLGDSVIPLGNRLVTTVDPLTTGFRLPGNESLRMNRTTAQALHAGNCTSGCP